MMSYLLLAFALLVAALVLNANFPIRRSAALVFPSFVAGWLTSELALQLLALEAVLVLGFGAQGGLQQWPGMLGLVILLGSSPGVLRLWWRARDAANPLDTALQDLGSLPPLASASALPSVDSASTLPSSRVFYPFVRSDRGVRRYGDLRYAEGAGRAHLLDVYVPAAGAKRAPVLLQIHGGGWFTGNKRQQAMPLLLHMARCGWVCVACNYRLSPGATFPEHLIDTKLALRWIREHIAEYGGDPDYVVTTGGSAGGHLSALLALTPNLPEYQPNFEAVDTSVRACVPLYGVYDLTDRLRHQRHVGLRELFSRLVLKQRFSHAPEAFDRASPLSHVGPHAPPFFVIHGTHDNMASVEDARELVEQLRAVSRGPVLYAEIPGAHHAFEIFHSTRTAYVVHAIARFLQALHARHLREHAGAETATETREEAAALTGSIAVG
ncbi:MAG TPA: alpha/beta hydrolase [Polyangiales bacterium]|nr:alpha/beta hydrolase [Polyangiales bacterium]